MNSVFLSLIAITSAQLTSSVSLNDTQCIENPTGEVSLNVAVRGVPGPEGPQGLKGDIGPAGEIGLKGNRGMKGSKGDLGDIGPVGPKGTQGEMGKKGQKGGRGIQGIPGPAGLPGLEGPNGPRGFPGPDGAQGPRGPAGLPGPRGSQGEPGDTFLNEEEFHRVTNNVHNSVLANINNTVNEYCKKKIEELNKSILQEVKSRDEDMLNTLQSQYQILFNTVMAKLMAMNETVNDTEGNITKCGMLGNWRRIAYFDTTQGDSCPIGLRTVTNTTTTQTACGRTNTGAGCTSLTFPSSGNYSKVCGRVRGYQFNHMNAFAEHFKQYQDINGYYVDGVSIIQGQSKNHLWTYAVGRAELDYSHPSNRVYSVCPCNGNVPGAEAYIPSFVSKNYYCESGFVENFERRVAWEDPLWDGSGCHTPNNTCCDRSGFFYRNATTSTDDIEVRWCSNYPHTDEDSPADQLEIWVM